MTLVNDIVSHDANEIPNTLFFLGIDPVEFNQKRQSLFYKAGLFLKSLSVGYELNKNLAFDLNLTPQIVDTLTVKSYEYTYEELNFAYMFRLNDDTPLPTQVSKLSVIDLNIDDILAELQHRLVDTTVTLVKAHNWWIGLEESSRKRIEDGLYDKHNQFKLIELADLMLHFDIAELNYMRNISYKREQKQALDNADIGELYMLCAHYYDVDMVMKTHNQQSYK